MKQQHQGEVFCGNPSVEENVQDEERALTDALQITKKKQHPVTRTKSRLGCL